MAVRSFQKILDDHEARKPAVPTPQPTPRAPEGARPEVMGGPFGPWEGLQHTTAADLRFIGKVYLGAAAVLSVVFAALAYFG